MSPATTGRRVGVSRRRTVTVLLLAILASPAVYASASITSDTGGVQTMSEGDQLVLTSTASGILYFAPFTYYWDIVDVGASPDFSGRNRTSSWEGLKALLGANPDGDYTVLLVVYDAIGLTVGTDSITLRINNLAPTGTASGDVTINEGADYTLTTDTIQDPGGDALVYDWDMDDDGDFADDGLSTNDGTLSWAALQASQIGPHPDGTYTFNLRVRDTNNNRTNSVGNLTAGPFTLSVTVTNTSPTGGPGEPLTGANAIDEGTDLALVNPTFADPGGDPLTYEWDLDQDGDFTNDAPSGAAATVAWADLVAYLPGVSDDGDHQIDVRVKDDGGLTSPVSSLDIHIKNLPATGGPGDPLTGADAVDEGSDLTLKNVTFTDPGGDTFAYQWDLDHDGDFADDGLTTAGATVPWADLMALLPADYPDGTYSINVRVLDEGNTGVNSEGNLVSAVASLDIEIANLAPTGTGGDDLVGANAITEGMPLTLLNATFADPGGDPLRYEWDLDNDSDFTNDAPPTSGGSVAWADLMTYLDVYPEGDYTIGVRVSDTENAANLVSAPTTLSIAVVNQAPTGGAGDDQTFDEGTDLTLVNATFADPGGDPLTYHWDLDNDGDFANDAAPTSTPVLVWAEMRAHLPKLDVDPNDIGVKVADVDGAESPADIITVAITNLAPTAVISGALTMQQGSALVLDGGGSTDPGLDDMVYAWELNGDDSFDDIVTTSPTFAKVVSWSSLQAFGFDVGSGNEIKLRVTDAGNVTNLSDEAVASVTVENTAPTAEDDALTTTEDTPLVAAAPGLLANDSDSSGDTPTVVGGSSTGATLPADAAAGTPFASVRGATVTVLADGGLYYDPDGVAEFQALAHGEHLDDTFNYFIEDEQGATDWATVTITVEGVNDAPVAVDDAVTVLEDTPATLSVLDNDFDLEGPFVSPTAVLEVVTAPLHGTLGVDVTNLVLTYAPYGDYSGDDSFVYRIIDGGTPMLFDTASVSVTVEPVNDPPEAVDDFAVGSPDGSPIVIDILANDSDLESPTLDVDSISLLVPVDPAEGVAEVQPDGTVLFTPDPAFQGLARFVYRVYDFGQGTSAPRFADAEVLIAVNLDTLAVDSLGDGVDFDISAGELTLREATVLVEEGGAIAFDTTVFAGNQIIKLDSVLGAIELDRPMAIARLDAGTVVVSGNRQTRILDVQVEGIVIAGLTLTDGGPASGDGGAILVRAGAALTLQNSTVASSVVIDGANGGGIENEGTLRLHNCTLMDNEATLGGAVHNVGTMTATNTTAIGNIATGDGGAIYNAGGSASLTNATLVGNTAEAGGGIAKESGAVHVSNTLLAGNTATAGSGGDAQGAEFASNGHNIIGDSAGSTGWAETDLTGLAREDVVADALQSNGGQMPTLALLPHSPAIDGGDDGAVSASLFGGAPTDQRGTGVDANGIDFPRIAGDAVDIGAYETNIRTVNSAIDADDLGPVGGSLTLRKALRLSYPGDTIFVDVSGEIALDAGLGALTVLSGVGIVGPGADLLALSGGNATPILYVQPTYAVVSLTGLTLADGYDAPGIRGLGGAALYNWGEVRLVACVITGNHVSGLDGGAIFSRGRVRIDDCVIEDNGAGFVGGAILNRGGAVTITGSVFSGNEAGEVAGAVANMLSGSVALTDCLLEDNVAGEAGAVRNGTLGTLSLMNCTFRGNVSTSHGGAIVSLGALNMTNTTVSGNNAKQNGGGLYMAAGTGVLTNCTIVGNQADVLNTGFASGGGIRHETGTLTLVNTIVATNYDTPGNGGAGSIHPDVSGGATSLGHNLIGIGDGAPSFLNGVNGDQVGLISHPLDPMLGPLGDYGGPTPTHTPMAQSPLIDAGNTDAIAPPAFEGEDSTDQRGEGFARVVDGDGDGALAVDIGAVEFSTAAPAFTSAPVESATEDQLYLYVIVTGDTDLGDTASVTAPTLPSWLALTNKLREVGDSIVLTIPDPVDGTKPIQWRRDEVALADTESRVAGSTEATLTLSDLALDDSGAYTATYNDGSSASTYGPVHLEVVEVGVLPIAGVYDNDNVGATPILCGRPSNEDIGIPYDTAVHEVVLRVEDWAHATSLQAFDVTIIGVNDAPDTVDDTAETVEDRAVVIGVLNNDSDVDGQLDKAAVTILTPPANGIATVHPTRGEVTYTPSVDFNGNDTFTYSVYDLGTPNPPAASTATVTVEVAALNDSPVAGADTAVVDEDHDVAIDVLANDYDVDGSLVASLVVVPEQPAHGTATVDTGTGTITYTPDADFEGVDEFTYRVFDDGTPLPMAHGEGLVTVTVNGVNDAPVALDNSATTNEDTSVVIAVLANDSDIDGTLDSATLTVTNGPSHGTAVVDPASGTITYAPDADYAGGDSFDYAITDDGAPGAPETSSASVTVTVVALNDPPRLTDDRANTMEDVAVSVDVLANDLDVDGALAPDSVVVTAPPMNGTTTVDPATGVITYTPDADTNGTDTFQYRVTDTGAPLPAESTIATVRISVFASNDAPRTVDDVATMNEDTTVTIDVLANDSDVDGELVPSTVTVTSPAAYGATEVDPATGAITYTPVVDFYGVDTFEYRVADDGGPQAPRTSAALVTVTVKAFSDEVIVVNTLLDQDQNVYSPDDISLREAIGMLTPGGTIRFAPELAGTISLSQLYGEITIQKAMTIEGPGTDMLTIDGGLHMRVLNVDDGDGLPNTDVVIQGLGLSSGDPGDGTQGGCLRTAERLTLEACTVSYGSALAGGGIYNSGALTVRRSAVFGNQAVDAGGVMNTGSLTFVNTTISSNQATDTGAGIYHASLQPAVLVNCTVTANLANDDGVSNGAGAALFVAEGAEPMDLRNTLAAGNFDTVDNAGPGTVHPDVAGSFAGGASVVVDGEEVPAGQYNLIGNDDGASGFGLHDIVLAGSSVEAVDVLDSVLRYNGGPVPTHALVDDGIAVGAGDVAQVTAPTMTGPPFTDGRGLGYPRIMDGMVDIGAYESHRFCDPSLVLETQLAAFREAFGVGAEDIDGDGLPEPFIMALWAWVHCGPDHGSEELRDATRAAYLINLSVLESEADGTLVRDFWQVLAYLFSLSQGMQDTVIGLLGDSGISLTGEYVAVTCDPETGECMPELLNDTEFAVFEADTEGVVEPYSGAGDLDGDGLSNLAECDNIVDQGGTPDDFANAASDPSDDGTALPLDCHGGAKWRPGGLPLGDLTALTLMVLVLLAVTRRPRRTRVRN